MFLSELKKGKSIVLIVLLIILLTLPLHSHVYHMSLYYIIVVLLIPLTTYRIIRGEALEKKFYFKWEKRREKGRLANMIMEGVRAILFIVVAVFSGQFFGNGYKPSLIISELPINVSIGLLIFIFVHGAICGIVAWYENEKRFNKISLNLEQRNK